MRHPHISRQVTWLRNGFISLFTTKRVRKQHFFILLPSCSRVTLTRDLFSVVGYLERKSCKNITPGNRRNSPVTPIFSPLLR